jgi:uncharacterized protein
MTTWRCVKQCGACCNLNPTERPDLDEYLSPEELTLYLSMVGEDGWCVNFNSTTRECQIYDMFGVEKSELNDFAIDCCRQQIEGVYGTRSLEMLRFNQEVGI